MNNTICHRVAQSLSGRALWMEPHALRLAVDALSSRLGLDRKAADDDDDGGATPAQLRRTAELQRLAALTDIEPVAVGNIGEYVLTPQGVAIVSVIGTLVSRYDWLSALCGFVSYDALNATFDALAADDRVKAALLDVASPGGEAANMLDCADRLRALGALKPVWGAANSLAASAGYGVIAATQRVTLPRIGMVGSVGVVALHIDQSGRDEQWGLKFTPLYSGARKIDGWGHDALTDEARQRFQARLDQSRLKFAGAIAEYRNMSLEAVMATEADVYDDDEAVAVGFADAVQSFDDTFAELAEYVRPPSQGGGVSPRGPAALHARKETDMGNQTKAEATTAPKKDEVGEPPAPEDRERPGDAGDEGETDKAKASRATVRSTRADAADIAALCAENGVPKLAADLIRAGVSMEDARAKIDAAGKIRARVADARKVNAAIDEGLADEFIAAGLSADAAGAALLDRLATMQSGEIRAEHGGATTSADSLIDARAIHAKFNVRKSA